MKFYGENKIKNIYLDNGASTLALKEVKKAGDEFLKDYGSVHRGSGYNSEISTKSYEDSRKKVLKYLDGNSDDAVIFTSNTTDGINKFALMSNFKKVLISDIEHSSNKLIWKKLGQVVELETKDFRIELEDLENKLKEDKEIDLVALTAASNISGFVSDVKGIYEVCKKYNVPFFLDASQYAPHFKPSLNECDVMVYCGHKMYAPFGAGILAGKKSFFRKDNKSITGGGNVLYVGDNIVYKDAPDMHESGTPNGIGAVTIAKAHEVLYSKIGEEKLVKHTLSLADEIDKVCDSLEEAGYKIYFGRKVDGVKRTPILVLGNTKMSNKKTVELLNKPIGKFKKNIFCREGAFCAYRVIEKLGLANESKVQYKGKDIKVEELTKLSNGTYIAEGDDYTLSDSYSLIRFSAGLINTKKDISYLVGKLIEINKNIENS